MSKAIFLDFDGVLNSDPFLEDVREKGLVVGDLRDPSNHHMIDPEKVALLNDLVERSGAEIVISSSWRHFFELPTLGEFLRKQGFRHSDKIVGRTPRRFSYVPRGYLISEYLTDNPEIDEFVILDDVGDAGDGSFISKSGSRILMKERLVQTDPTVGLTQGHVDQAVSILGGEK